MKFYLSFSALVWICTRWKPFFYYTTDNNYGKLQLHALSFFVYAHNCTNVYILRVPNFWYESHQLDNLSIFLSKLIFTSRTKNHQKMSSKSQVLIVTENYVYLIITKRSILNAEFREEIIENTFPFQLFRQCLKTSINNSWPRTKCIFMANVTITQTIAKHV